MNPFKVISQTAVMCHMEVGSSVTLLVDGSCMFLTHPGQWVRGLKDATVAKEGRVLTEKKDIRSYLWEMESRGVLPENREGWVLWTLFEEEENRTLIGLGTLSHGPLTPDEGFRIGVLEEVPS